MPELSPRETLVLRLMAEGYSNPAIARALHLSESTIKTYIGRLFEKTGSNNRIQACVWGWKNGIITDKRVRPDVIW